MWIDFEKKKLDMNQYFSEVMNGVLFRHQTTLIGIRTQLSLTYTYLFELASEIVKFGIFNQPEIIQFKNYLFDQKRRFLSNEEVDIKKIVRQMVVFFIRSEEYVEFLQFSVDMNKTLREIEYEFKAWMKKESEPIDEFLKLLQQILKSNFENPLKLFEKKANEITLKESQILFRFMFGGGNKTLELQKDQIKQWNDNQPQLFILDIRNKFNIQSLINLQLLEHNSYKYAIIDLATSFEDWIAFYISLMVKDNPRRFQNTNVSKRFKDEIADLLNEFEINNNENHNRELENNLRELEMKIVGFSGYYLDKYLKLHCGLKFESSINNLFDYYREFRNLRNSLVHPLTIQESKIKIPTKLEEFEEIIKKLKNLGNQIIKAFGKAIFIFD